MDKTLNYKVDRSVLGYVEQFSRCKSCRAAISNEISRMESFKLRTFVVKHVLDS